MVVDLTKSRLPKEIAAKSLANQGNSGAARIAFLADRSWHFATIAWAGSDQTNLSLRFVLS